MSPIIDFVPEDKIPSSFNVSVDDELKPQRELEDFIVRRGSERTSICSLDESSESSPPARATGKLVLPGSSKTINTETGDLEEWCIEYGTEPSMWIRSANVWYRLGSPAPEYAATHDLARRRFELCSRIYILATTIEAKQATFKSFVRLLGAEWNNMRAYKEKDILAEKSFILSQVKTLNEKALNDCVFFRELRSKKLTPSVPDTPTSGSATRKKASAGVGKGSPTSSEVQSVGSPSSKRSGSWVPRGDVDDETQLRILRRLEKIISTIMKMKNALPFLEPVDPVRDEIPDYLERIKKPMDYGTIKQRLVAGDYYQSASDVVADVRQVTKNCIIYNGHGHLFSKYAIDLERKFETQAIAMEEAEIKSSQKKVPLTPVPKSASKLKTSSSSPALSNTKKSRNVENGSSKHASSDKPPSGAKSAKVKVSKPAPADLSEQICINSADGKVCGKRARAGSRYCGDECGMAVARKKLQTLLKEGVDVDNYLRNCVGKALVGLNPLNR